MHQKGESTDDYIDKVIRAGKDIKKTYQETMDQIYQGLDSVIVIFFTQRKVKILDDMRKFARMGQSLEREMTAPSTEVHRIPGQKKEVPRDKRQRLVSVILILMSKTGTRKDVAIYVSVQITLLRIVGAGTTVGTRAYL